MRSVLPMRIAKVGYIVMSTLFCVMGGALLLSPARAMTRLAQLLGIALIVFGGVKLVGYFSRDLFRLAFQYDLAFGLLLIALGTVTLSHPNETMSFLTVMFGIPALTDGLFKVQIALDSRRFGIRSWWFILALAVLNCGVGAVLMFRPSVGMHALTALLGISLLLDGAMNLTVALCTVKIVTHQKPDIIEGCAFEIKEE